VLKIFKKNDSAANGVSRSNGGTKSLGITPFAKKVGDQAEQMA
jgi:hypothetical protein